MMVLVLRRFHMVLQGYAGAAARTGHKPAARWVTCIAAAGPTAAGTRAKVFRQACQRVAGMDLPVAPWCWAGCLVAVVLAVLVLLHGTAHSQYLASRSAPQDWDLAMPDPEPALPAGFDAFDPPLLPAVAAGPVIAEASRTAGPGESFVVTGLRLGLRPSFRVYSGMLPEQGVEAGAKLWWSNGAAASAALPRTLGQWATYAVWPENDAGVGRPFFLNRTEAWWAGPSPAVPGGHAAVYGRNLSQGNGSGKSWVYLKLEGHAPGQWADVVSVNPYKVEFVIPPGLEHGTYEVWVHNGHGGRFGWGGPASVTVSVSPWASQDALVFDVRAFGARGDGITDDAPAIDAALIEAERNAPATVFFPHGRYAVSHGFSPPSRVRWKGAGPDETTILAGSGFGSDQGDPRTYALLFAEGPASGSDIEVSGLTLDASAHPGYRKTAVYIRFAHNIVIRDVRIQSKQGDYFHLDGSRGVFLHRSELVGTGGFLGTASQVFIEDCNFLLTNNANSAVTSWGGHDIAIVGNHARDLNSADRTETGAGRFFVSQAHFGGTRRVYIADNTTRALGPPSPAWAEFDQNSGEQVLFEHCCNALTSEVAAASPSTVALAHGKLDQEAAGQFDVLVVGGRGMGQHRHIAAYDPARREITVSSPWLVVPDRSSVVTIAQLAEQVVIYRNSLDGKAGYANASTASSGVRLYGNTVDTVVAANRFTRVRGGVELWALGAGSGAEISPVFFNLVTGNVIAESYDGISMQTMYLYTKVPGSVGHLGNIFRGNHGEHLASAGIRIVRWASPETGAQMGTVFEANRFTDVLVGLFGGEAGRLTPLAGIILEGNVFERGSAPCPGSVAAVWPADMPLWGGGNRWLGFEAARTDLQQGFKQQWNGGCK